MSGANTELIIGLTECDPESFELAGIARISFEPSSATTKVWMPSRETRISGVKNHVPAGFESILPRGGKVKRLQHLANWCIALNRIELTPSVSIENEQEQERILSANTCCSFRSDNHEKPAAWLINLLGNELNASIDYRCSRNSHYAVLRQGSIAPVVSVRISSSEQPPERWIQLTSDELSKYLSQVGINLAVTQPDSMDRMNRDWIVPLKEFGLFLGKYRNVIDMSKITRDDRRKQRSSHSSKGKWLPTGEQLDRLETGQIDEGKPLREIRELCSIYDDKYDTDMPELMAEWLCARPSADSSVRYRENMFSEAVWGDAEDRPLKAIKCTYRTPLIRLQGLDCAIGICEFAECPEDLRINHDETGSLDEEKYLDVARSTRHQHMGDEIIICLDGKVMVELANSGLRASLRKGDLIHFNSDVPHSVWNFHSTKGKVLVLRFFQIDRNGTRQDQIQAIRKLRESVGTLLAIESSSSFDHSRSPEGGGRLQNLATTISERLRSSAPRIIENFKLLMTRFKTENENIASTLEGLFVWWTELEAWLQDRATPAREPLDCSFEPDKAPVRDWIGLASMVEMLCRVDPRAASNLGSEYETLQRLTKARIEKLISFQESEERNEAEEVKSILMKKLINATVELVSHLQQLSRGSSEDLRILAKAMQGLPPSTDTQEKVNHVDAIAQFFGLPRQLLIGFCAPPVFRSIVLRTGKEDWIDAKPNPAESSQVAKPALPDKQLAPIYQIPARVLANSDITVNRLVLPKGSESAWNWHGGFELVLVESGIVRARQKCKDKVTGESREVTTDSCRKGEILVFRSQIEHRVENAANEEASVLLIRFNVFDSLAQPT